MKIYIDFIHISTVKSLIAFGGILLCTDEKICVISYRKT